jgi:anion-transporting  ArsA/GET3 family ATPase
VTTGVAIVTTPEEMPVTETITLLDRLEPETGVRPTVVVANRVLPELFDREHADVIDRLDAARPALVAAAGRGAMVVVTAARISEARRRNGDGHLARLAQHADGLPMLVVPELFTRATGRRVVALVADALAAQLELER